MHIDGRKLDIEDVLIRLRDAVRSQPVDQADVTVLVGAKGDAARVRGFASMSGFEFNVAHIDEGYLLTVKGGSCRCV